MNTLKDIIERCHQRHKKPLRQRKTVITPAPYKGLPYHFTVYCGHRYPVRLYDLEQAAISFMPIGRAPQNDYAPKSFDGERFLKRQGIEDWEIRRWHASWGIQVYTGTPSGRDGGQWHDLNFTYNVLCAAPEAVFVCIETLVNAVANPLLTLSKSGGLRFSCRIPNYLHSKTEDTKQYIYKHTPTSENPNQREVYLEIFGEEGYNCWDARYEILLGNLLDPPIITKEVLFDPINVLQDALHEPEPPDKKGLKVNAKPISIAPISLGSYNLDLAKEAFLKRGFTYVQQENGYHCWRKHADKVDDDIVFLWESEGTVWVRASTSNIGLPTHATAITEIWDDTGILPTTGLPVPDNVLTIREGKLSPLALKRPSPVLQKPEHMKKNYDTFEQNFAQIQRVYDSTARIIVLNAETGAGKTYAAGSYVLNGGAISLNASFWALEEVVQHFQKRNIHPIERWRARRRHWDKVKDIPIDVRMANPFQHGNLCEDYERCEALEKKGGNPDEIICPQCPVYTECKERGYLSQPARLNSVNAQISGTPFQFFDPQYTEIVEKFLEPVDDTERLCIIDAINGYDLFFECDVSKRILEEWCVNWQEDVLGQFAQALLYALEMSKDPNDNAVRRIRTAVHAFQQHEAALVKQMCQVKVQGRIVSRGYVDIGTGEELARWSIEFEGGVSAYIPLDKNAKDKLEAKGLPLFQPDTFALNEDMIIPMPMKEVIQLGILNTETVQSIQKFPTVCRYPNWTLWHQLKHFLSHYTRNADAPMILHHEVLWFWVPPVLHSSIKRLLLMSSTLSEQDVRRALPDEEIEVNRIEPAAWVAGNQVFQIRTGTYPLETILEYYDSWDVIRMSKMGQRVFLGIRSEIERDPKVKHAIITDSSVVKHLANIAEIENVCFITDFKQLQGLETAFEEAQVVWIVGTPPWEPGIIWRRAQILFGDNEEPLCYERETELCRYKDKRVQSVYEKLVVGLLTKIIGLSGLTRLPNKKVVLVTSFPLPDITDRPETLLFDWEDFEVAGGLDKLSETIATRQHFETERDNLTAESGRDKVQHVLGCSTSKANRVLRKFRGGKLLRVPFKEQIFSLLAEGEKKTAELMETVEGHPTSVKNELKRLVDSGEVVKVHRGVYSLPES